MGGKRCAPHKIPKTISEVRMENETIIKKETQALATIQNYFNDLSTSAPSVTQEERYDNLIDLYSGTATS